MTTQELISQFMNGLNSEGNNGGTGVTDDVEQSQQPLPTTPQSTVTVPAASQTLPSSPSTVPHASTSSEQTSNALLSTLLQGALSTQSTGDVQTPTPETPISLAQSGGTQEQMESTSTPEASQLAQLQQTNAQLVQVLSQLFTASQQPPLSEGQMLAQQYLNDSNSVYTHMLQEYGMQPLKDAPSYYQ